MTIDRILERVRSLQAQGLPFAFVTVLHAQAPTSAKPGDKAIVENDGTITGWVGGGCAQPTVIATVKEALRDGRPRHIRIAPDSNEDRKLGDIFEYAMPCFSGGTLELFVDPVLAQARLVVLGVSPVAQALARVAPTVGFRCTVIGRRADPSLFPGAESVVDESEASGVAPGAYVVVATQGKRDIECLRIALSLDAAHVAFVASAKKAAVLKASLKQTGSPAEAVDAIEAPAGLSIGAVTPEEIALSVLARVVGVRRRGREPAAGAQPATLCDTTPSGGSAPAAALESSESLG